MYEEATLKKTTFWSFIRRIYLPKYFQSQEILEQHYPMDFLRWWKYSLFALSKMVATPTYGYLIRSKYKLGSRKSRDTWSKRQIWPQSTKWSRSKANRLLPREHTGCSKHPLSTTQEKALHSQRMFIFNRLARQFLWIWFVYHNSYVDHILKNIIYLSCSCSCFWTST